MIGEKDHLAIDGECSRTKTSKPLFSHLNNNNNNQSEKTSVRSSNLDVFSSKSSPRSANELTLSYLCENRDLSEKISDPQKGKEVVVTLSYDENRIERDFFNLRETKRKKSHQDDVVNEEVKIDTLNLSLSLTASNGVKRPRVTTTTSFSNDFTAPSISNSCSHGGPFSHNMSCSMTLLGITLICN